MKYAPYENKTVFHFLNAFKSHKYVSTGCCKDHQKVLLFKRQMEDLCSRHPLGFSALQVNLVLDLQMMTEVN